MLYQAIVLGLFIKKNTSFEASKVKFTLVEIGKMAIMTVIMIFRFRLYRNAINWI